MTKDSPGDHSNKKSIVCKSQQSNDAHSRPPNKNKCVHDEKLSNTLHENIKIRSTLNEKYPKIML